jgi:sulfate adenylyltransferase subunit 2
MTPADMTTTPPITPVDLALGTTHTLREAARHGARTVLLCSFQKEESVLLDELLRLDQGTGRTVRIVTIDTGVLFEETMQTWKEFEERFGVSIEVFDASSPGAPWSGPEHCCSAAKVAALERALDGAEGWITGIRREQGPTRAGAELIERDAARGLWKYNPLAYWTDKDIWRRIHERKLPYHPLHDQGYESIGCAPCTRPGAGREGRWAGMDKTECGLHEPLAVASAAIAEPARSDAQAAPEAHGAEQASRAGSNGRARPASRPQLSHLRALESEAIHVMREVAAEFERPVMLFSGGKDSIVLLRLAEKAFRPGPFPFPLMHVDTGHNFPEVIEFRDRRVAELGERLVVASVQDSIDKGRVVEQTGPRASRNQLQTVTLLDAIAEHGFDAAFGGARRDEERARAKERIFSFRDDFGQWDPKRQRPELWNLYNGRIKRGENVRVFPISNWTELDVWEYIDSERLEVPSIYFAHQRPVFRRDGMLYAWREGAQLLDGEEVFEETVRYRTVGDMSCTGGVVSSARTLGEVVAEIAATRITERGETRADDRVSEAAMEDRKKAGYF